VPAKKLIVSTYLQYILIAVGAFLLVVFVRQLSGVLLTFLMAAILAYVFNPVVRRLEQWRIPRVVAVVGVFLALILLNWTGSGSLLSVIMSPFHALSDAYVRALLNLAL
jgi:predicted PurR-regulated permease PerM